MDEVHNLLRYLLAIAHLRGFCIAGGRLFVGVGGSIWRCGSSRPEVLTYGLCLTEVKQQQVLIPLCLCDCQR